MRYKFPEATQSALLEVPATDRAAAFENASADFKFAAAVAAFGMILRDSPLKGTASIEGVLKIAASATSNDSARTEFVSMARKVEPKLRKK